MFNPQNNSEITDGIPGGTFDGVSGRISKGIPGGTITRTSDVNF